MQSYYKDTILYSYLFSVSSNLVACLDTLVMRRVWEVNQENTMGLDLTNLRILLPGMIQLVHMQNFRKTKPARAYQGLKNFSFSENISFVLNEW